MKLTAYITGALMLALAGTSVAWTWQAKDYRAKLAARDVTIAALNDAVIEAKSVNDANMATLEAIKADLARQAEIATKFEKQARARGAALKATLKRIEDAPATDDGPVAPVLGRELERLRNDGAGQPATDRDHQDPAGALPDLGAPSVPAAPTAPTS